ncbi:MAG: glycosyltransferase family 2 protein [Clostridia bacterium]
MISVIMPVYNCEKNIEKTLKTFCEIMQPDDEIIIVDDVSKDKSFEICTEFSKKDARVKVFKNKENLGAGPTRNVGINLAKSDYLYFCDADDYVSKDLFKKIAEYLKNNTDCDLLVFGYDNKNYKGEINRISRRQNAVFSGDEIRTEYNKFYYSDLLDVRGAPWNKVFKRSIIEEHKILYPNLRRNEDQVFIMDFIDKCDSVHFIDEILYTYQYGHYMSDFLKKFPVDYYDIHSTYMKSVDDFICKWSEDNIHNCKNVRDVEYVDGLLIAIRALVYHGNVKKTFSKLNTILFNKEVERVCLDYKALNLSKQDEKIVCYINKKQSIKIYLWFLLDTNKILFKQSLKRKLLKFLKR